MRHVTSVVHGRHETRLVVFEADPGGWQDPVRISDEYVVPERQGQELRISLVEETLVLRRDQVAELAAGLLEWLAIAGTPRVVEIEPASPPACQAEPPEGS